MRAGPIRNPVTAAETHPGIALPDGFVREDGAIASSKVFRVDDGITYDHSGKYAALAAFDHGGTTR